MKKLKATWSLLVVFMMIIGEVFASCPQGIITVFNGTSGNGRAPNGNWRSIRTHYLITPSEMAAFTASEIGGIEWEFSTAPTIPTTGTLRIYLEQTTHTTNSKSSTWSTAISTMTLVHDATTVIPAVLGKWQVVFSLGAFSYTPGNGLYVAFEWLNCSGTLSASTVVACNTSLTNGLYGVQSTLTSPCPTTSPLTASSFRPITGLIPGVIANDAKVDLIYTLGKLPNGFTSGHQIQALITNSGSNTLTNLPVTLTISGANSFTDVQTIASLASCASTVVTFGGFTPSSIGTNTISVSVAPDDNNANNTMTMTQDITANTFSYRYPGTANTGGVGYSGGTGEFCGKFHTSAPALINEVQVDFFSVTSTTYQLVIYDDDGTGRPGAALYDDAAFGITRTVSFAGTQFLTLIPGANVPAGNFFVTVRQTNTINCAFAYTSENPIRQGSFFYRPTGFPSWIDLHISESGAVLPFRFNITVNLDLPTPPECATSFNPPNGGVAGTNPTLTWASGGGGPTSYDVYFGSAPNPPLVANTTSTSYSPGLLTDGATYYWKIVPKNDDGDAVGCPELSFTVDVLNAYCTPPTSNCDFDGPGPLYDQINNVTFANINHSSTCTPGGYYLHTDDTATIELGSMNLLSVNFGNDAYEHVAVWIDWDRNGAFDTYEYVLTGYNEGSGQDATASATITTPLTAPLGLRRMRVREAWSATQLPVSIDPDEACSPFPYGETEDYFIKVVPPNCSFTGLPSDMCEDAAPVLLTPVNPSAVISGPGIVLFGGDYYFDPGSAGVGTHTITCCVGSYCCTENVTVHALPTVTMCSLADMCELDPPVALTCGTPGGGTYVGTGVTDDGMGNYFFDPGLAGAGDHLVFYLYTDANGCSGFDFTSVHVHGSTVFYTDADADGYGDPASPVAACDMPAGTVANSADCDDTDPNVNPGMAEVCSNGIDDNCDGQVDENDVSATVSPAGPVDECHGAPVMLTATPGGPGPHTYQWYKGLTAQSGATDPTYTTTKKGTFYVAVSNGICTNISNLVSITRKPTPSVNLTNVSGTTDLCVMNPIKLKVSGGGGGQTFLWYKDAVSTGVTTKTYLATTAGCYTVVVTNPNGCSKESAQICLTENCTRLAAAEQVTLNLYPNPADRQIVINAQLGSDAPVTISLVTLLGQEVLRLYTHADQGLLQQTLDLPATLAAGNYLVRIVSDQTVLSKQLTIQR